MSGPYQNQEFDLRALFESLKAFKQKHTMDGPPRRTWLRVLPIVLVAIAIFTAYYQVEPDEVAIIQRFGKFVGTADPGPHFRLPFGIDRVRKVPLQRQLKVEFGFRTLSAGVDSVYQQGSSDLRRESTMLTGDLNVAVVEWIVQYKIKDPYKYIFKVRNIDETLRSIAEASMRTVVGDHSVNEVLTTGRQKIATQSKELLQNLANRFETGVDIQQVVLQDVNPPDPVKPSFNEVNQAIQEKERAINEAHAEANKEIPKAKGEAEQAVKAAEGYAIERINKAKGETSRFLRIYSEYKKAPEVTRKRMYLETLAAVLPHAGQKYVVDDTIKGLTPILNQTQPSTAATAGSATHEARGGAQ